MKLQAFFLDAYAPLLFILFPSFSMDREPLITTFLEMNGRINLSAIRDAEGVRIKHIMDSLELTKVFPLQDGCKVCDIGTGWGFPLLPLAMTYPKVHFVGIDSTRKKIDAINSMIKDLHIENAQAIWTRSEDYQEQFDVITARAVGYIDKIFTRSYQLLKKGGHYVLYKQVSQEEKADLLQLCKQWNPAKDGAGLRLVDEHVYRLFPEDIERVIYIIRKN